MKRLLAWIFKLLRLCSENSMVKILTRQHTPSDGPRIFSFHLKNVICLINGMWQIKIRISVCWAIISHRKSSKHSLAKSIVLSTKSIMKIFNEQVEVLFSWIKCFTNAYVCKKQNKEQIIRYMSLVRVRLFLI